MVIKMFMDLKVVPQEIQVNEWKFAQKQKFIYCHHCEVIRSYIVLQICTNTEWHRSVDK